MNTETSTLVRLAAVLVAVALHGHVAGAGGATPPDRTHDGGGGALEELLLQGLDQILAPPEEPPAGHGAAPAGDSPTGKPPLPRLDAASLSGSLGSIAREMQLVGPWIADRHDRDDVARRQVGIARRLQELVKQLGADRDTNPARRQDRLAAEQPPDSHGEGSFSSSAGEGTRPVDSSGGPGDAPASSPTVGTPRPEVLAEWADAVWGHLPLRTRESFRLLPAEEFLPKYRAQIENYYRQLAEQPDLSGRASGVP